MRALLILLAALAIVLCLVPLGLGGCLLITPSRAGNLLNDAFAVFPPVKDEDRRKHWFYRALGLGCVTLSGYFFRQIWAGLVVPVLGVLR